MNAAITTSSPVLFVASLAVLKSELTELSSFWRQWLVGLLSLLCYPSLRASRGAPDGRTQTERNLQLYESLPDPRKKEIYKHTHTPGRYIYWLGVGWLAIPGNLTIPFLLFITPAK